MCTNSNAKGEKVANATINESKSYLTEIKQFIDDFFTPSEIALKLQSVYFQFINNSFKKTIEIDGFENELFSLQCLIECFQCSYTCSGETDYLNEIEHLTTFFEPRELTILLEELYFQFINSTISTDCNIADYSDGVFIIECLIKVFQCRYIK